MNARSRPPPPPTGSIPVTLPPPASPPRNLAPLPPTIPHDDTAPTRVKHDESRLPSWSASAGSLPLESPAPQRRSPLPPPASSMSAMAPIPREDPSWTNLEPTTGSGVRHLDTIPPAARSGFWRRPGLLPGFVAGFVVGGLVVIALVRLLEPDDPTSSVTSIASPTSTTGAPAPSHVPTVKADDLPPAIFRIQDLPSASANRR
jgi:hypothetical protein